MTRPSLQGMDLNLLVVLEVLLRKQSVVAAARELGVGQPAISKKLARLRHMLGDPLLVRQGRRMVPTPRAEKIAETLAEHLLKLRACVAPPRALDLAACADTFRIGLQYYPTDLAAGILDATLKHAPGLNLHFLELQPDNAQKQLNDGHIDLLVHVGDRRRVFGVQHGALRGYGRYAENLYIQELYDEPFVTISRRDPPTLVGTLDLETFARLPHVLFSAQGDAFGFVDAALQRLGRRRRIGALIQNWTLGCEIVVRTGYLMTLNQDMALHFKERYPIAIHRPPVELPRSHLSQLWHERHQDDALHQWIRQRVFEVGQQIEGRLKLDSAV